MSGPHILKCILVFSYVLCLVFSQRYFYLNKTYGTWLFSVTYWWSPSGVGRRYIYRTHRYTVPGQTRPTLRESLYSDTTKGQTKTAPNDPHPQPQWSTLRRGPKFLSPPRGPVQIFFARMIPTIMDNVLCCLITTN